MWLMGILRWAIFLFLFYNTRREGPLTDLERKGLLSTTKIIFSMQKVMELSSIFGCKLDFILEICGLPRKVGI